VSLLSVVTKAGTCLRAVFGNIQIAISSPRRQQEIDTWMWLFGIEERYKGKLCQKRGAYAWLSMVLESPKPIEALQAIRSNARKDRFLDDGFLKMAVFEDFEASGLLKLKNRASMKLP
jgi:hypothetical protein